MSGNTSPLNEFITLQRGHDLPHKDRNEGNVPVVASTGVAGYHNEAKAKAPGVVIGRSGSIGGGQYITEDFWPLNTTLWVKDFKGHNERFVYYLLKNIDFTTFNVGTGVPTLNRNHLSSILVNEIGRDAEDQIAKILGDLDDKIALNTQINQTLEAMAQALFKSWFVDFDPVKAKMEARASGGDDEAVRHAAMAVIGPWQFRGPRPIRAPQPPKGGEEAPRPPEGGEGTDERLAVFEKMNPEAYAQLAETADLFPEKMVESELGEIPEGWEVKAAESIVIRHKVSQKFTKKNVSAEGEIPVFDQSSDLILGYSNAPADIISTPEEPKFFFGDHTCVTHISTKPFSVGPNVIPLSHKTHNPYWTYYAIKDLQTFQEYRRHWMEFQVKEVICPAKEIAGLFGYKVKDIHLMLEFNNENSRMLSKTRDALLPKLLSGEIDLSSFGVREGEE